MIYGYARVSTKGQANDGNSLEAQVELLKANGASKVYQEAYTGTKVDRPEFDKLLSLLQEGDTLMVTKLDRFARTAQQGLAVIDELLERGISVHILNMGKLDNTSVGKLIRTIMFAFAEYERDMIVERTSEGKAIARAKGVRVDGRPLYDVNTAEVAMVKAQVDSGELNVKQACEVLGIARSTWYNRIAK